jgi:predicted RNA-binding Zn-ribbon protein involved in translation (DUF1610 family)
MSHYPRKTALGLLVLAALALEPATAGAGPTVSAGKVQGAPGKEVEVPILVKGVKDIKDAKGLGGMSLRLSYDPQVLTFKSIDKGPALPNAMIEKSVDEKAEPGKVGLVFACSSKAPGSTEMASVQEDGVVLKVMFVVNENAPADHKSPLKLDNIRAGNGADPPEELLVVAEDGEFTVHRPGLPLLWILIGVGAALLLLLVVLVARRGRKERPEAAMAAMPGPAVAPGTSAPPRFHPEGTTFAHTCPKCGGVIQLPKAMMGHSFQCGACGTTQIAGS